MANYSPPHITGNRFFGAQVFLRLLTIGATLAAAWLILTSKETVVVLGMQFDARYTYSQAFKFFAYANIAACGSSVLSLFSVLLLKPRTYFVMFLHDLIMSTLLMAGCAAATAIGWVGKYGNNHIGWTAVCDHFKNYCNRTAYSVVCSYAAVILYLLLTIISAKKSRNVQD
ncbi:CASP-like protein 1F1 [Coffea arabica]|uniref:CASP-like protein n=1 Tax=Coffea arabica TaxID=13443 RepID=A0ABM4U3X8_COFAR